MARKLAQLLFRMLRYGANYVDVGAKADELQFEKGRLVGITEAARALGFARVPSQPTLSTSPG